VAGGDRDPWQQSRAWRRQVAGRTESRLCTQPADQMWRGEHSRDAQSDENVDGRGLAVRPAESGPPAARRPRMGGLAFGAAVPGGATRRVQLDRHVAGLVRGLHRFEDAGQVDLQRAVSPPLPSALGRCGPVVYALAHRYSA
jgi:hypothetical protein